VRICVALVVAMLCAACLGGSAGHRAPTARPSHLGVTAAFPSSWSVAWRPCRDCADPCDVFAATSYRTGAGARSTMCGAVPNHGVAISLDEVLPGLSATRRHTRVTFRCGRRPFASGLWDEARCTRAATSPARGSSGFATQVVCSMRGSSSGRIRRARCVDVRRPCWTACGSHRFHSAQHWGLTPMLRRWAARIHLVL